MGKYKNKRHKGPKMQPTGLPSVQDVEAEMNELGSPSCSTTSSSTSGAERISNTVLSLVEKLQSPTAEDRECACSTIANLVSEPASISQFLQADAIKILGPMLVDASFSVRATALGALRNMSVEGGSAVCEKMVEQDVMTPVITLMQQYGAEWKPTIAQPANEKPDPQTEVFLQLVHLLWNLCESSETAVKICNQQNVLRILLPCLQPETHGYPLALVVAQCLQTLTDNNPQTAAELGKVESLGLLTSLLSGKHESIKQLLLRTLAAGILHNVAGGQLNQAAAGLVDQIVQLLAEVLRLDIVQHLQEITALLKQNLDQVSSVSNGDAMESTAPPSADMVTPDGGMDTATQEANKESHNKKKTQVKKTPTEQEIRFRIVEEKLQDVEHLLSAQQLALQLLTNLCYADDGDDETWEDCDSSDNSFDEITTDNGSSMDTGQLPESDMLAAVCVPSEVHASFVNHQIIQKVVSKMELPNAGSFEEVASHDRGPIIIKSMSSVQTHALLCVSNLVGSMEVPALGGVNDLQQLWVRLGSLLTSKTVLGNAEQLEAVTTALRSVVCKLGHLHSAKLSEVTDLDLQFLFDLGLTCDHAEVRANIVKVVSTVGCELGSQGSVHPLLKPIGEFLLTVVDKDAKLWVVGEALDSIFDVFAEDHTDPVLQDIDLIPKLRALTPALKAKINQQKRHLGEHLAIISTARTNLARFIKYKSARLR